NPDYMAYHRYSLLPDEIFFPSIIKHLEKDMKFKIQPSITYTNWVKKGRSLPVTFLEEDTAELEQVPSDKLMARKFNMSSESGILDILDKQNLANTNLTNSEDS